MGAWRLGACKGQETKVKIVGDQATNVRIVEEGGGGQEAQVRIISGAKISM